MDIVKDIQGTEMKMHVSGRLDTTTAPELDAALGDLSGITRIDLDFEGLEYLSSAGLRVLLSTQKTMSKQGELVLHNVCEEILEVFEMTGFADLLTIE